MLLPADKSAPPFAKLSPVTTTADNLGAWSITSTTLSDGTHTLTAMATDTAGNLPSPYFGD